MGVTRKTNEITPTNEGNVVLLDCPGCEPPVREPPVHYGVNLFSHLLSWFDNKKQPESQAEEKGSKVRQ